MTLTTSICEARCHVFRVWRYPRPQRCFTALALHVKPASRVSGTSHEQIIDIPIPALDFDAGPDPDERLQGIAKLRGLDNGQ
jgi:hypothetical protein